MTHSQDHARLELVYKHALARSPKPQEMEIWLNHLQRSLAHYRESPQAAKSVLKIGEHSRNEQLDEAEHASWTNLCLAIFNLDEALTRE